MDIYHMKECFIYLGTARASLSAKHLSTEYLEST